MNHRMSALFGTSLAALTMLFIGVSGPASAHHGPVQTPGTAPAGAAADRDGDADSDPATAYTEDTDSDGVANNIADAGDNAHPSGRDRSVESGGSGIQGRSESIPDQNGRGPERNTLGTDKPNGSGGTDIFDQDGNNGCGNDDDFDDDNEGRCGRRTDLVPEIGSTTTSPSVAGQAAVAGVTVDVPGPGAPPGQHQGPPGLLPGFVPGQPGGAPIAAVLGEVVVRDQAEAAAVLGTIEARGGVALALTGGGVGDVVAAALGLLLAGVAIRAGGQVGLRRGRRDR